MIVLKPTTDTQTFKFIPRNYDSTDIISFRDDTTNVIMQYSSTIIQVGDYLQATDVFNLVEGRFYDLTTYEIKGSYKQFKDRVIALGGNFEGNTCLLSFLQVNELVSASDLYVTYTDKVFCTAQEINQTLDKEYNINKGVYITENTRNNDYVVL
tara:strand:+ start:27 stop:488 length:462 start_codon:yes stop_codon:yes gene_type:complete